MPTMPGTEIRGGPCALAARGRMRVVPMQAAKAAQEAGPSTSSQASPAPPSKGFGSATAPKSKKGSSQARPSQAALKKAPKKAVPGGRVDMVEVTDWGSGEQSELGELKVKKSEILFGATAKAQTQPAASNADQASSASEASSDASTSGRSEEAGAPSAGQAQRRRPPSAFDQLCREIAMAEKRGALRVAGPAPPPFDKWSFTPQRYHQYLVDCLAVHTALEHALSVAASASGSLQDDGALQALAQVHSAGVHRAAALEHDLARLSAHHSFPVAPTTARHPPTTSARTLAQHIDRLARDIHTWSAAHAGPSDIRVRAEAEAGGRAAAAEVLAYAVAVYVLNEASSMRVGAVAVEKLSLLSLDAARFYKSDGTGPSKEPLRVLRSAVDAGWPLTTPAQQQRVLDTLPNAARDTARLLTALAHTD